MYAVFVNKYQHEGSAAEVEYGHGGCRYETRTEANRLAEEVRAAGAYRTVHVRGVNVAGKTRDERVGTHGGVYDEEGMELVDVGNAVCSFRCVVEAGTADEPVDVEVRIPRSFIRAIAAKAVGSRRGKATQSVQQFGISHGATAIARVLKRGRQRGKV